MLFFVSHVVCKISNFNMWTAKHLAQASCTELTLPRMIESSCKTFMPTQTLVLHGVYPSGSKRLRLDNSKTCRK